jgi:serine/threonine protein kinase
MGVNRPDVSLGRCLMWSLSRTRRSRAAGSGGFFGPPTLHRGPVEPQYFADHRRRNPLYRKGFRCNYTFGTGTLYERLTGRRAFDGGNAASVISAIMTAEPPALPPQQLAIPPALDGVLQMCIAKDPDDRWQSASDVRRALQLVTATLLYPVLC